MQQTLLDWIGTLTVTQGRLSGQPFVVAPWQRRFLRGAFRAGVSSAGLSVGRGNGKSTLTAAIATAAIAGPLAQPRADVVCVASSFTQARIIYEHVLSFMRPWLDTAPTRWRIQDSANRASVEDRQTGARVRCLGSDPRRAHGLAPVLVLADEPAQWPTNSSERMHAALLTALGKIPHSRLIALGTRPADTSHWFSTLLGGGPGIYSQCHAAERDDPPFVPRTWRKANPSLSSMPDLAAAIRTEADRATTDASLLPAFQALRLNQGTADTERAALLSAGTWEGLEADDVPRAGPCIWGIDAGTTAAMTAACAFWPESGRLDTVAAFPSAPTLAARGLKDGVGDLYQQMARRDELVTLGGRVVPLSDFVRVVRDRFGVPAAVVADRWREGELRDALDAAGLPRCAFVLRGQGYKDGAEDVRAFRTACLTQQVKPAKSLLLRAAMREATVIADPAGNEKLSKASEGGRRFRAKDDAVAAAILAVSAGVRHERPRPARVYHGVA